MKDELIGKPEPPSDVQIHDDDLTAQNPQVQELFADSPAVRYFLIPCAKYTFKIYVVVLLLLDIDGARCYFGAGENMWEKCGQRWFWMFNTMVLVHFVFGTCAIYGLKKLAKRRMAVRRLANSNTV